jgi:hypothetical protein
MMILQAALTVLLLLLAGGAQPPASQRVQRLPLQKKPVTFKSPSEYAKRFLGTDSKTGQERHYDPRPQIAPLDQKSGLYALKWIGYDGKEKTVVYQRPDAIDAIVSANVSRLHSGKYLYSYSVRNLPSSGEYLRTFALQTFTSDAKPHKVATAYIGPMSPNKAMKEGNWIGFAIISDFELIGNPGKTAEFRLESLMPPGLVECRVAGGKRGMIGVGEEMPMELENLLPGYEAWPSGHTIAPISRLQGATQQEKVKYLLQILPKFKQQGWLIPQVSPSYEQLLRQNDLHGLLKRIAGDLKVGSITSEVFAIVEAMKN